MTYNTKKPTIKIYSKDAILLQWAAEIKPYILQNVLKAKKIIDEQGIKEILYINNTYNSILIKYVSTIENIYDKVFHLEELIGVHSCDKFEESRLHHLPVCYDIDYGIDLDELKRKNKLSIEEIVRLHSEPVYQVYFIGFLPGFLYLGGLDSELFAARKPTPRQRVLSGSVGIGGKQTGIYPQNSPGGWNIIGNSPVPLFDVKKNPPCFIKPGDRVKFNPITKDQHFEITQQIQQGTFKIESEVQND